MKEYPHTHTHTHTDTTTFNQDEGSLHFVVRVLSNLTQTA